MITFTLSLVALVSKEEQQQLREKYLEKHTTPCDTAFFPSRKEQTLTAIDVAPFVDETDKQKMRSFVEGLADALSELRDTFAYREFENLINQVFSSKRPNDQEYELST